MHVFKSFLKAVRDWKTGDKLGSVVTVLGENEIFLSLPSTPKGLQQILSLARKLKF